MSRPDREGRRAFLEKVASAIFAGLALSGAEVKTTTAEAAPPSPAPPPPFKIDGQAEEDILIRMQRDLERALRKPMRERRWGMVIDTRKCIGCSSCTVCCVLENKLPPGVVYRPVIDMEVGEYPNVTRKFLPRPCNKRDARRLALRDGDVVRIVSPTFGGEFEVAPGVKARVEGKVRAIGGIAPGAVAVSWHYGHWAYGAADVEIDGQKIPGDKTRARGQFGGARGRLPQGRLPH